MRRLWPVLLALLGLTLLAAAPASAAIATQLENRTSGSPSGSNNLVGIDPRLSENAVRENVWLGYEGASGSPVAARATAATRANQIQSVLSPRTQRSVTTAVTETSQGTRVVTSSEGRLRPAQRAALQPGEVAGVGQRGVHAEVNGVNAAREMGLNPTGVAPSRPACPGCTQAMDELGIPIIGP